MSLFWTLDPHTHAVMPCTVLEWEAFMKVPFGRLVKRTSIAGFEVSTVFTGLAADPVPEGMAPRVFETMVFGGSMNGHIERTASWDDAVEMHESVISIAKAHQRVHRLRQGN